MILNTSILPDHFMGQGWPNVEGAVRLLSMQSDFWLKGI